MRWILSCSWCLRRLVPKRTPVNARNFCRHSAFASAEFWHLSQHLHREAHFGGLPRSAGAFGRQAYRLHGRRALPRGLGHGELPSRQRGASDGGGGALEHELDSHHRGAGLDESPRLAKLRVEEIGRDDAFAVGTALTGGPPHRSQRALLTHWAPTSGHDAQSLFGVRVQNTNRWKPAVGQTVHALPGHPESLAPLP